MNKFLASGKTPSRESPVHDQSPFNIFSEFPFLFDNTGLMKYQINTKKTHEDKLLLHVWKVTKNNISCFFCKNQFYK